MSLNAVSLQEALMNRLQGKSNRQFWLEQSFGTAVIPGITAIFLSLTPGGLFAYPPFVIGQLIGMSVAGGAGMIYNRSEPMRNKFGKSTPAFIDLVSQENKPLVNENLIPEVQEQYSPPVISPSDVVSSSGENIFAALMMAAVAGAGYKLYRWYNAPKEEKPVEQLIQQSTQNIVQKNRH